MVSIPFSTKNGEQKELKLNKLSLWYTCHRYQGSLFTKKWPKFTINFNASHLIPEEYKTWAKSQILLSTTI